MSRTITQPTSSLWHVGASGCSETFKRLTRVVWTFRTHATEPLSLGWKRYLHDRALALGDACSREGWDGYDASPVSSEAVARTLLLIELLPEWVYPPELAPSPEGEISFEWYSGKDKILSVTPQKALLVYAAALGTDHTQYGKAPVLDSWPSDILSILSKHFYHARPLATRY